MANQIKTQKDEPLVLEIIGGPSIGDLHQTLVECYVVRFHLEGVQHLVLEVFIDGLHTRKKPRLHRGRERRNWVIEGTCFNNNNTIMQVLPPLESDDENQEDLYARLRECEFAGMFKARYNTHTRKGKLMPLRYREKSKTSE